MTFESESRGQKRARNLEALVWVAAAMTIIVTLAFASIVTARAAAVAAIFSSVNFTLGRFSLAYLLNPRRAALGRLGFGFLYLSKLALVATALAILRLRLKLSVAGLLLGFSVLPLALYALLAWELLTLRRTRKD